MSAIPPFAEMSCFAGLFPLLLAGGEGETGTFRGEDESITLSEDVLRVRVDSGVNAREADEWEGFFYSF